MSDSFDYDLFVIGGGSGGVRASRMAASGGARVGVAEEYRYGGTCVIRGCVPKKLMVYASSFAEAFEDAEGYGWTVGESRFDWTTLIAAKDKEIARLEALYEKGVASSGGDLLHTRAELVGPHEVRLVGEGRTVSAKHILIATGGAPFVPDIPGAEHAITSNEIFHLPELPRRILIVGGGFIACEFAGILHGLGAQVTLVYRRDLILRGFDDDVRAHVSAGMIAKGIDIRYQQDVASIDGAAPHQVTFEDGGTGEFDCVFFATGRKPNTEGMGLERAGVKLSGNGAIAVDQWSQTNIPSIYAVGDVTDRVTLTPVAIREGAAFVETVFNANPTKPDHADVPSAVFTQPEVGAVGLTEAAARKLGEVDIYRSTFRPMFATLSGRDEKMLMKLVVMKADQRVRGVHIVGHGAAEMVQLAGVAVKMGATKEDFDRTVAVHPTAAEELVTMRDPV
ncbi:glutathione-disulfide reductase [Pikeienuella piscinae]|uniref:Glutathione reductase n=1 Tax=Pikeienuella piscinae TaxID=2748098 RepID=A0A7L5BVT0_9RHOB|nr:glutathione-disulfide reductase [Pikeienuella piscinae]QIE54316.1 glutathione-disulfide reductase [Pikeienuella piscinae]